MRVIRRNGDMSTGVEILVRLPGNACFLCISSSSRPPM